jgi:hypothetical protein
MCYRDFLLPITQLVYGDNVLLNVSEKSFGLACAARNCSSGFVAEREALSVLHKAAGLPFIGSLGVASL